MSYDPERDARRAGITAAVVFGAVVGAGVAIYAAGGLSWDWLPILSLLGGLVGLLAGAGAADLLSPGQSVISSVAVMGFIPGCIGALLGLRIARKSGATLETTALAGLAGFVLVGGVAASFAGVIALAQNYVLRRKRRWPESTNASPPSDNCSNTQGQEPD